MLRQHCVEGKGGELLLLIGLLKENNELIEFTSSACPKSLYVVAWSPRSSAVQYYMVECEKNTDDNS